MPYVYRYTDKNDDTVKYIGIIKRDTNFPNRFAQHYRDRWYKNGKWKIEYINVDSVTDAEMLEAHFIWAYGTDEYYNTSKTGWGKCSYVPDLKDFDWTVYSDEGCGAPTILDRAENILNELNAIDKRQQLLWKEYEHIKRLLIKDARTSIREWMYDCIVDPEQVFFTWQRNQSLHVSIKPYELLLESYNDWLSENPYHHSFAEIEDIADRVSRNSHLKGAAYADGVHSIILKETDEYEEYQKIRVAIDAEDMKKLEKIWELMS